MGGSYAGSIPRQKHSQPHRYRFTATYLERLIRNGFRSPHRVLNQFIKDFSDFEPSDADEWCDKEHQVYPVHIGSGMNFEDITGWTFV
jgi:hypothetical protein